jgi:predicted DNA-binding protein (UPF0251 family)
MSRPFKCRRVGFLPGVDYFKPRGIPISELEEVNLTIDELEALRLADLEGLYHEQAAKRMDISRQTFGNIINSAHKKIADSIINSKAIKIEGGVYTMTEMRKFVCSACRHEWEVPYGTMRPQGCPQCQSRNIHRAEGGRGYAQGAGRRFGECRRREA